MLELPRRHLVLEQQIDLSEWTVLGLRQAEVAPDIAEQIGSCVEESGLCTPIPTYKRLVAVNQSAVRHLPMGDNILGVTELWNNPVRQYTNRPIQMVLYRSRPEGVSATIG